METKKSENILIQYAPRGYIKLICSKLIRMKIFDAHIPFGMNKNYTIKVQLSKKQSGDFFTQLQETEKGLFEQAKTALQIAKPGDFELYSKTQKKGSYLPTIMCTIAHIRDTVQTTIVQKHKGEIVTVHDLKNKRVNIQLVQDHMWEKNNTISITWIVEKIELL